MPRFFGVEAPGANNLLITAQCPVHLRSVPLSFLPHRSSSFLPCSLFPDASPFNLTLLFYLVLVSSPGFLFLCIVWLFFLLVSTAWCSAYAVAALLLFSDISILSLQIPPKGPCLLWLHVVIYHMSIIVQFKIVYLL